MSNRQPHKFAAPIVAALLMAGTASAGGKGASSEPLSQPQQPVTPFGTLIPGPRPPPDAAANLGPHRPPTVIAIPGPRPPPDKDG